MASLGRGVSSLGKRVGGLVQGVAKGGTTPARLRAWMVATAIVAVLFGVLSAAGVDRRASSLRAADAASQQLIAVQDVQVRLVHADAIARENYLRGGIEDGAKRATYAAELALVSDGLVTVGNSVLPNEAAALAGVSTQLSRYSGLVEQARANNRQGFPVGAAYLRTANALADEMVTGLRDVQASLRTQVNDSLDRADKAGSWLHLTGWPLLILMVVGGAWMAYRFRRVLNVPLALAGVITLLLLVVGGSLQASAMSDAADATTGELQSADLAAQARSSAFTAHAQEFSTLIARGSGGDDSRWDASFATTELALDRLCDIGDECSLKSYLRDYASAHAAVRESDNGGDWDGARESSLNGESAIAFTSLDEASRGVAASLGQGAAAAMSATTDGLAILRVVCFVAGLLVAALVLVGYSQRLREYR
jgi:hypothetical protein